MGGALSALVDARGREVVLERSLGRGGEGTVYAVAGQPRTAAKVYARPVGERRVRKLEAMIELATPALQRVAAWPTSLVRDCRSGAPVGFLLPRLERHRPIHAVYCPATRKRAWPAASWSLLVRVARNLAVAFDAVHAHGHVVGDVNQGNAVVSGRALVTLIDCDSFQVARGDDTFSCDVGVPLFTAPELQGRSFVGLERTADHDAFGLAVLAFHLLVMGRHPFAGCRDGIDVRVESAIRTGAFAFGTGAAQRGWQAPPSSLRLAELPHAVAGCFERAFAGGTPRPTAREWATTLGALEGALIRCAVDARHVHANPGGTCPWCRIERGGGPSFFGPARQPAPPPDAESAWRAIEAVRSPGAAGPAPGLAQARVPLARRLVARASSSALDWRTFMAGASFTFAAASAVMREPFGGLGLLGLWALRPRAEERARRREREQALRACESELRRLQALWGLHCGDTGFRRRRRDLEQARRALEGLAMLEEQERRRLGARVSLRALERRQRRRRESLVDVLRSGVSDLERCRAAVLARRVELRSEIERASARVLSLRNDDLQ